MTKKTLSTRVGSDFNKFMSHFSCAFIVHDTFKNKKQKTKHTHKNCLIKVTSTETNTSHIKSLTF